MSRDVPDSQARFTGALTVAWLVLLSAIAAHAQGAPTVHVATTTSMATSALALVV